VKGWTMMVNSIINNWRRKTSDWSGSAQLGEKPSFPTGGAPLRSEHHPARGGCCSTEAGCPVKGLEAEACRADRRHRQRSARSRPPLEYRAACSPGRPTVRRHAIGTDAPSLSHGPRICSSEW
jgi:hypothetical protein